MCGIPSTNPSPWDQDNKFRLNQTCLRSFVGAFGKVEPKVIFLLDHCSDEYLEMINLVPFKTTYIQSNDGINATMIKAYDLATNESDLVLFQECDYLYQERSGGLMVQAIEELGLVSPYDHLNFYVDRNIHSSACEVELVSNHHFRTTERNTMTWGCHSDMVRECCDTLIKYGYLDDLVWRDLRYAGHQLWVPMPSLATHCVKDYLSPGVDWEKIYGYYAG